MHKGKVPDGTGETAPGEEAAKASNEAITLTVQEAADEESTAELDAKVTMRLGRQLSSFYGELIKQPVPDEFIKLLEELAKREKNA